MGLFKDNDWRLAKWALMDETIPLKCAACGAQFITKNRGSLGKYPIYYGTTVAKQAACRACEAAHHSLLIIDPDKKAYLRGDY